MAIIRPSLKFDFANAPGFIDPRATFGRASTGTYWDRNGILRTAPANVPRFDFDPITGLCRGLLSEPSRTNLALHARELDNAAWTKSSMTVTANQAAAADGTTALEKLTSTGANGNVAQAFAVSAGANITISIYARASTSSHLLASISDGTNAVTCWFNLGSGAVATNSAGTGTCVFSFKDIENCGGGLYRCMLTVATATSTSFFGTFGPAAADNTATANADEIYAGDAQFEAALHASSFIATTAATVTRSGDYLSMPLTGPWWNALEGAIAMDVPVTRRTPNTGAVFGGFGDTFANTAYLSRSANEMYLTSITATVAQAQLNRTLGWSIGARNRFAVRFKLNDFAMVANGGTAVTDTSGTLPTAPVRFMVGAAPYSATGGTNCCECIAGVEYYNRALTTPDLQTLTAS